jgi:hypothetical protein
MTVYHRFTIIAMMAALFSSPASAGTLTPISASDLVTLESSTNSPATGCKFGRQLDLIDNSDGTLNTFAGIPSGRVLVVTTLSFVAAGLDPNTVVNGHVEAEISNSSVQVISAQGYANGLGQVAASFAIPNGAPIKNGVTPCFVLDPGFSAVHAIVHGYFAIDR